MKKGKPSHWPQPSWLGFFALIIGFALWRIIPFSELIPQSNNYQCLEEIPQFNSDTVDRVLLIETLGFDHPQLLEGIVYDSDMYRVWLTMTCSVVSDTAYIILVYPNGTWDWRMQVIHFEANLPIIQTIDAYRVGEVVTYIGQEDGSGAIIADNNHNGLPEAIVFFQGICNCLYGDIWIVEFMPDGSVKDLTPEDTGGLVFGGEDWNGDGLIDLVAGSQTFVGAITTPRAALIYIQYVYNWNGSAYALSYLEVEGISSEMSAHAALERVNADRDICKALVDNRLNHLRPSGISRTIFSIICFYDRFLHERERAWELINPLLDEASTCPFDPTLITFFEDMAEIHQYFEGN